jgi:hypothetical protein
MRIRFLFYLTAFVSAILGATVVYLVLSVPNDLRADALLKEARQDITSGRHDRARKSLSTIIQQYPRTDAAAAATVALVSLAQKERDDLARAVERQSRLISDLQKNVTALRNAPPRVVTVTAPAPAPKPPAKKATPKKKPTKRRRR